MLKRLCAQLDSEMKQALKPLKLNLNQFAVLMTVMEYEGLTQTDLGEKIGMPGYATTRSLDALEENNRIERRTDKHSRRAHRIYLTNKGQELGPALFKLINQVNSDLLSSIAKTEQNQFKAILKKMLILG